MKAYFKLLLNQVLKNSLYIVACITTFILLSSPLYADSGKDFLSKEEQEWLAKNQSQIVRAIETGYAPFVFIDSKDRPAGLAHDYMLLLESKLGVQFKEKRFSTLNEIFDKLKSGEVHIVNAVTNTPARSKFIIFTAPFISVPNVIIVQNNRAGRFKEETLNGLRVSLVKGYAVTEHFTNKGLSFTPDLVPDDITALYNVSSGHTDAAIIDLATASYLISTKGITNLRIAGETTFTIRLAMGTSIAEPMLNSIIQKGLAQITDPERKEIRSRWINASSGNIFADWRFWAVVISALFALCAAIFGNILWNRSLRRQVALRTEELTRETEALQKLKEELQAQNEVLRVTEEDLRSQNDQLMATEEMLRFQICEHEIIQKLLHDSEERYRLIMESVAVIPWEFNIPENRWTYIGPQVTDLLGYSPEEWTTLEWWQEIIHPEDQTWMPAYCADLTSRGAEHSMEYRLMAKDGSSVWVNDLVTIEMLDGKPSIMRGVMVDITDRKKAEVSLRETNSYLDNLFTYANAPIIVWDTNLRITRFNKAFEKLTGRTSDEVIDRDISILFPADQIDSSIALIKGTLSGERWETVEIPFLHVNGSVSIILWNSANVFAADGTTPVATIAQGHDITERKKAEEEKHLLEQQFQHTQKLESLGVLAGGIAHDFNNILAIIMGYCSLTKMNYEDADKHIPEIEKAAERAAALCRQMLAYAGKASLTQNQVNTWMLVDEMVSMLKTTIQQNAVIKPELSTDVPFIMGDASQLRQVVMNLIINAAEAIGDAEGEIDVKLTKAEIWVEQPEQDHLGFTIPAGRYIRFEVTDNGCGMDDETKSKIFEPFYTTKFTGRGLGMSAVLGIIKAHNGALQLESRLGHGTTFRVYLPVPLSKSETEEAQQITASAAWQGSGTILLAEDEVQVKSVAIILLKEMGFNVLDTANGKEALELYLQNAADITMVITDMGMPVMNGYDLFYKLKQLNPGLPIVISSGFGEGDIGSKIPREAIAAIINKPYKFEQLREVLRGVVEGTKKPMDKSTFCQFAG